MSCFDLTHAPVATAARAAATGPVSMSTRPKKEISCFMFLSEKWQHRKNRNDAPGEKSKGCRYLSPKGRKFSEKSEPSSVRLHV